MHEIPPYQQLFKASPHPYLVLRADSNFTIVAVNNKYLEVTGTRSEAMVGRGLFDIFPDNPNDHASDGVSHLRTSLNHVLSKKHADVMSVQKYDIPLRDGSGNFVPKYWSPVNTPVLDAQGHVTFIIHHVEDVTEFVISREQANHVKKTHLSKVEARVERMEAEIMHRAAEVKAANRALKAAMEELSHLNQRLTELDQLKSQFFANISHELRTPLTLILAPLEKRLSQLANDDDSTGERREIELMLRNARLLYRHVTDLLDAAKLEAGCVKISWVQLDLAKLVRMMASHFESLALNRRIAFEIISPKTLVIESDGEKLQRVLLNLLSNAFKFTQDDGRIAVHLSATEDQALIEIQDNGPGVQVDMRERVFERFAQVENSSNRHRSGTGLGLAIVKDFVGLLGGKIVLEESPGGGALFKINLPQKAPANVPLRDTLASLDAIILHEAVEELQPHVPAVPMVVSASANDLPLVLVVEDNFDMNHFIAETLRSYYRVVCAFNGKQGLEQALVISPDLILSDLMMPVMDGEQMVLELRQWPHLIDVPIVMLTAKVDDALCVRLFKMGVQDFLSKPFAVGELLARVGKRVTERQRMKEQLRESEARFQATFEQAAVGMAIVSPEGHWLRVNNKLCEIVGYSHDELMALTFQDITHAGDLNADLDYVRKTLAGEITTYSMEKRYLCKDSSVIWVSLTASLVRKSGQSPDYFITIIEVIQARKETETNLREAKRIANLGHWKWDVSTNSHTWSEEIYRIYGRDLDLPPASYQEVSQYFTPESWVNLATDVEKCLTQGLAYQCDAEVVRSNGEHRWIIARGEVIRDAADRIVALHGTVQDITERKLAEVALQESKEQLKLFIEYAPASLAMFDRKMCYLALSQRWRDDYLLGDRDLLGLCHYDIFPDIRDEWKAIHRQCLAGEVVRADEDCYERADGSIQWLRWEVRPWYQVSGAIGGMVIFTEDITPQKEAEEALHQLNDNLEKRIAERTAELNVLNQSLESFVYSVSHDLKAPLRGVEGYSRLLEEDYNDRLDEEGRLFINNIRAGVTQMNELINDLLAYSRMERRKLESNALDLTGLVQQVLVECDKDITFHQIEIAADLPPFMVHGDREGLALVLRNLLENAIKFSKHSPHPRIEFGASQEDNHVTLWVRDNGIGFDMKYNQRIFEIFERLHRLEDYPGTGIGLALVKKAMERMGGRVWAQSVPGEGATFHLELLAVQET
ncbi:MAG: PAS domain S-box protein [Nitrosomonas sp.]|uniref:PAS domain S-box protein n=1 Tax=Nitrosomonas sp. TaxID=42353 RepID=UPI00273750C5|nr:PAS domain S-box protein [Nitrosomonas sp.]MDP3280566.1 PAS domain S-box protein [Nitrosomonas sp.]MDP3664716.1 PAS domain S-box protein [Nitrosomonas sp.]MDZ4105177.1 PAS domain S-box protein [Nitrosomonas sp.]